MWRNGALCAFAGLWEKWAPETGEPVETFAIVTTRANKLVSEVHERMPVIIAPADYQRWLTGPDARAKGLLPPKPARLPSLRAAIGSTTSKKMMWGSSRQYRRESLIAVNLERSADFLAFPRKR